MLQCVNISITSHLIYKLSTTTPSKTVAFPLCPQITRKLCEQELLRVKGVISFTFDMSKSRCTIRCRTELAAEELCTAVNKTKVLTAEQVVRNECGEEVGSFY